MSELILIEMKDFFKFLLLDYENHHNRIKVDFDRVFDHNISIRARLYVCSRREKEK